MLSKKQWWIVGIGAGIVLVYYFWQKNQHAGVTTGQIASNLASDASSTAFTAITASL